MKKFIFLPCLLIVSCMELKSKESVLYSLSEKGLDIPLGKISVEDYNNGKGIIISVTATNLIPGHHGFHIHEFNKLTPSTNSAGGLVIGGMAGGHWDPDNTKIHLGPEGEGHRGDLPQLLVSENGTINTSMTNTRISFKDIAGKSFMVHKHPDNYSDTPSPLGGSGERFYAAPF